MLSRLRARAGRVAPNDANGEGETVDAQDDPTAALPRKNASIRGLRRTSTFKSISTLLLMASGPGATINVLRTSIMEMHERVQYKWVLHPMSGWKTLWDLISAMVVIFYSWMIPFMLCFDWYVLPHEIKIFLKVLDVWGFVDIALRFRTGIIEYGAVRMNPADIRKHYVRSIWFPIDIASTFPFEYFLTDPNNAGTRKTIKMIKYIKLPRLLRIGRFLKYVRKYKRYSSMVIALNALLFTSHVAGCVWVALLGPCDGEELYIEARCRPGMEMQMYWVAFHHGIVSLLGISANHIESADQVLSGAYHKPQRIIASEIYVWGSIVSVLGAVITASLFGTIINLVQSWNRAENAFRKKMDQISHEMDALSLPKHIRARVTAYYDYLWLNNRTFSDELNILKDEGMSISLRQQIAIYLFKDHLQKVPFFQLATDAVLGMICMQLHQVIFMPDDFIIREGDIGRELFMIIKGIVQVMPVKKANPTEVKKILLGEGDFFGEIAVVMEVERTRSVKAECVSELCILSREGFDKILVEFPEFATAMKRLIIKRVGEMYNTDNKENTIEKMTLLADYQMKKKIATYNNVKKLRSTAKAIQTIVPRLSKVVKDPVPAEVLGMKETELAELRSGSSAAVTIVPANAVAVQDPAPELEVIREWDQESEGSHTSQRNSRTLSADNIPIRLGSGTHDEIKPSLDSLAFLPPVRVKNPLVRSSTGSALLDMERDRSGRIEYVEARLMALEKKFDGHMHKVDVKIGQILDALGSLLNRSPTRAGPTTQVMGQTVKPRSRPASPHRDLSSQAVRSPSPTRDLATQARGLAIRVDTSSTSAASISSTGMTQSAPMAAKAPARSTEPSREFLSLGEESKQV